MRYLNNNDIVPCGYLYSSNPLMEENKKTKKRLPDSPFIFNAVFSKHRRMLKNNNISKVITNVNGTLQRQTITRLLLRHKNNDKL